MAQINKKIDKIIAIGIAIIFVLTSVSTCNKCISDVILY